MPRIFISYRRQDSSNMTGRIHDSLVRQFGDRSVFRDVYDIPAGSDFRTILNHEVSQGDIFLAIIGSQWVGITDSQGNRRLDDPNDFVRIEVESALKNPQTRVIPVLVNNANMPVEEELPESLKELCYRNAVKVRTDPDFPHDMDTLVRQLKHSKKQLFIRSLWVVIPLLLTIISSFFLFPGGLWNSTNPPNLTNTVHLSETKTSTIHPSNTKTPTHILPSSTPLVKPVESGEVMVLVAQFEQIGTQERNVTRFIMDDLSQRLEVELPFTDIRIREYKEIIISNSEALQISEQTQADIVIWGYYDADSVTANVQLGYLESHPNLVLKHEFLKRNANIRVKMIDERKETLANQVLTSLSAIYIAENESLKLVLLFMALDMLDAPIPEMIGTSNATYVHNGMKAYLSDEQLAIDELTQAIELDAGNPILYAFRGALYDRTGYFHLGEQDFDTAIRLAPDEWIVPYQLKGNRSLFDNNPVSGIENYSKVVEIRSEDWFAYNMRGYFYFLAQQYDLAREDIERSIELGPDAEYPYMWATLIAIRQGRISDISATLKGLLSENPDPVFAERYMTAMYGENYAKILGNTIAAMGHFALGQHTNVIQDTDVVLSVVPNYPEMYMLKGLSYCNVNDYTNAEAAYTQGLELDPSFTMLNFLRLEVRMELKMDIIEDLTAVQNSDISDNLIPYIEATQDGLFSCKDLVSAK